MLLFEYKFGGTLNFQHTLHHYRGNLVRHTDLACGRLILLATEDQNGTGGGGVEDEEQDGLLQVQLMAVVE